MASSCPAARPAEQPTEKPHTRATRRARTSYTVNANLTNRGSDTFAYDQANRLTSATVSGVTSTDAYDGDGKRTSQTVGSNTTTYVYDINNSLPNVLTDGTNKYVYGLGLAYAVDGSGNVQVYHTDGLGSVRAITNGSESLIQTYQTDEFGIPTQSNGTSTQPFGFTGQQVDGNGLVYLRARYYDPTSGRFNSLDPLMPPLSQPSYLHRYTYAQNNPVTRSDPYGLVTAALCVTGSLGVPGLYGTVSVCPITIASNGDIGVQVAAGGGGSTGVVAGISVGPQFSTGNSVSDLKGPFVTAGASARVGEGVGVDIFGGNGSQGQNVLGVSPGYTVLGADYTPPLLPGEVHGGVTTTWVASVNVPDLWRQLWNRGPRGSRVVKVG